MSSRPPARRRSPHARWLQFVRRYGWRAYALPVLAVITVVAMVHGTGPSPGHPRAAAAGHRADTARTDSVARGGDARPVRKDGTEFEGLTAADAGFRPASTPAPQVINLKVDGVTSCASNRYLQLVLVSISRQHLWACQGSKQINESAVTTGKIVGGDQTPLGSWRVQAKQRDRYLVGPGYKDYVRYWLPFNGDFGLHDAPWQTMPFGSKDWRTQGSHGCVHTPTRVMAWIYSWAKVGRTVVTIER